MNKIAKFCRKVLIFLNLCQKPGRFPKMRFLANKPISLAVCKCQLSAMKLDISSPTRSIFSQDTPWREGFFSEYAGNLNPEAELARSFAFLMFWQHLLEKDFFGQRLIPLCDGSREAETSDLQWEFYFQFKTPKYQLFKTNIKNYYNVRIS